MVYMSKSFILFRFRDKNNMKINFNNILIDNNSTLVLSIFCSIKCLILFNNSCDLGVNIL